MGDLDTVFEELFKKYFHILWEAAAELAYKTWIALWGALHDAAVMFESAVAALSARIAVWQVVVLAVAAAAGLAFWIFRENVYVRRLRHNIHWLRFRGYTPMVVEYRHGARHGVTDFLGRETPVPERFPGLRIFDAIPDDYVVIFGAGNGGPARMVRSYPRQTRAGREAMVRDLAAHVREAGRYVNQRSEVEALTAFLITLDPAMKEFLGSRGGWERRTA
jgi:hypothetical protein